MDMSDSSGYRGIYDFLWAVRLNRLGLDVIGLWPKINEDPTKKFKYTFSAALIFIIMLNMGVPLICALIRVWGDMILMVENLQLTLPVIIAMLKFVIMWWKRTTLFSTVKMIWEDWMELKLDAERDVMIKQARNARLVTICGYVLLTFGVVIVVVLPAFGVPFRHLTNLTDRNRILPLQAYYYYDTDKSPQYELTFLIQAITVLFGAITYMSIDTFLGFTILHICGQLENFRHRLVNLILCNDFDNALRTNVKMHLRLISFAANIEDIFAVMMLGLVFYFSIVFCLFIFLLLTIYIDEGINNASISRMYIAIIGIVILLGNTFCYCYGGEIMADQCEEVYRAICDLEWYKLESKNGKTLILLMIRANDSFRITAGKIIPLMMATFCSLLKTSGGYVSFLLAKRS